MCIDNDETEVTSRIGQNRSLDADISESPEAMLSWETHRDL